MTSPGPRLLPTATAYRLRPAAIRRTLLAGLAGGPCASAGFGLLAVGVPGIARGESTSWVFAGIGVVSLAAAITLGTMLRRRHYRGTRTSVLAAVLSGLPLAPLATAIVASVIFALAVGTTGAAELSPAAVYGLAWLALAAPGLVTGPLAWWWIAHLHRHPTLELDEDEAARARFDATVVERG